MKHNLPTHRREFSQGIKQSLLSISVIGVFAFSSTGAALPLERSSTQAFSIPNEVVDRIVAGPAITSIGGQKYLQYLARSDQDGQYQNIIAGPLDKLLDRTISWNELIYLNQSVSIDLSFYIGLYSAYQYALGSLVDLNDDGLNTLVISGEEYDINNNNELLSEDVFNGEVSLGADAYAKFVDVDGDGDLDLFTSSWKFGEGEGVFFENTGTPEVAAFVHRNNDINDLLSSYYATLPEGFYDYFIDSFGYQFPSVNMPVTSYDYPVIFDFDSDGDLDLLMAGQFPGRLSYFEQSNKDGVTQYSNPYHSGPLDNQNAVWITDFDTDGDMDLLVYQGQSKILFYEKISDLSNQYADPVAITNFPEWTDTSFCGVPNQNSISRSKEVFADLDSDGNQEMLVVYQNDFQEYKLLLLIKRDFDFFEQRVIYQGTDIYYGASERLEFVDANNDGKLDIALQFYNPQSGEAQPVLLFEQQDPFIFTGPEILASDALGLTQIHTNSVDIDFDGDGDVDTVYNSGVDWNLDSNPGSIVNFSTRSYVGEGSNVLIGGFIIEGQSPQTVILRGIGPSLANKGIIAPLEDPHIYLFSGDKLIAHNDDWQTTKGADKIESAGIGLEHPKESALRVRLDPGVYTVHLKGNPGDTGVGIIGVDADNQMPTTSLQVNISGRAYVDEGEAITIGGFVVEGDTPVKVLIRGLGPQLRNKGVNDALEDPNITLYSGDSVIARNNDWKRGDRAMEIAELDIAPEEDKDAAILRELEPGTYTVHLRGASGDTGVGIIAVDRL
jgi:hypothetical protein